MFINVYDVYWVWCPIRKPGTAIQIRIWNSKYPIQNSKYIFGIPNTLFGILNMYLEFQIRIWNSE